MIFLEFVCRTLLGPPASMANGCAYWPCPFCYTKEAKLMMKGQLGKFECLRCREWGDAFDLLQHFEPQLTFAGRTARLDKLRKEFEKRQAQGEFDGMGKHDRHRGRTQANVFSSPGAGTNPPRDLKFQIACEEFSDRAKNAALILEGTICEILATLGVAPTWPAIRWFLALSEISLKMSDALGLHPLSLAGQLHFQVWSRDITHEHMQTCSDADCNWYFCRIRNGWTVEQIEADLENMELRNTIDDNEESLWRQNEQYLNWQSMAARTRP